MLTTRRLAVILVLTVIAFITILRSSTSSKDDKLASTPWHSVYSDLFPEASSTNLHDINISLPFVPSDRPSSPDSTHKYQKALISGHMRSENTTWMTIDLPDIELYLYTVDDRTAPLHPPRNKGREAMVYLTFIIDHYTALPDIMIFMHAHRRAWHNADVLGNDAVQMVRRLSAERVIRDGYMNLRCQWFPGCPDWIHPLDADFDTQKKEQALLKPAWLELFPGVDVPETLAQPCCSQFAVSRDAVRSIPLEQWTIWRQWLLDTKLDSGLSGRIWEYIWQFVFTGRSVFCPIEHICYCDGFGVCFGGREKYEVWHAIRRERDRFAHEVSLWEEQKRKAERGGGLEDWRMPELARKEEMESQIERLQLLMSEQVAEAIERGNEPKNRPMETGIS